MEKMRVTARVPPEIEHAARIISSFYRRGWSSMVEELIEKGIQITVDCDDTGLLREWLGEIGYDVKSTFTERDQ